MEWFKYPSLEHSSDFNPQDHPGSDEPWIITEKIHGANISIMYQQGEIVVHSRNKLLDDSTSFFGFKELTKDIPLKDESVIIYGEIFGGKIQRELDYGPEIRLVMFDVWDTDHFLPFFEAKQYVESLGLTFTEPIFQGTIESVQQWITDKAESFHTQHSETTQIAEGVVYRSEKKHYLYKHRTVDYLEKRTGLKKIPKPPKVTKKLDEVREYLTEARYINSLNHFGDGADWKDIANEMSEDIVKEMERDGYEWFPYYRDSIFKFVRVQHHKLASLS